MGNSSPLAEALGQLTVFWKQKHHKGCFKVIFSLNLDIQVERVVFSLFKTRELFEKEQVVLQVVSENSSYWHLLIFTKLGGRKNSQLRSNTFKQYGLTRGMDKLQWNLLRRTRVAFPPTQKRCCYRHEIEDSEPLMFPRLLCPCFVVRWLPITNRESIWSI